MDEYEALKFASIFHDIGKLYQRADKSNHAYDSKYEKLDVDDYGVSGAHSKWSADFVKDNFDETVEDLVLYHRNPSKSGNEDLCNMIYRAVKHSSNEDIDSDNDSDVSLNPLTSVFSKISLEGDKHEDYYVPLMELDFAESLHPQNEESRKKWNMVENYQNLWNKFENEFRSLKNKDFESLLALLKKYTSTVPFTDKYSESDISLYDHLKTTAAIANCRYLFSKEDSLQQNDTQEVYRIINGDISGIQKFIYKVNTPEEAQSGMSKRLRGRSLYLTLLCEAISSKIIIDLNLDSSNILFCGGGRFTIIAPNTKKTDEVIEKINMEVNKAFIDKFNAELFLNIVSAPACGESLGNFDKLLSKLTQLLNENKKHKFIGQLEDVFKVESKVNYELCPVCGNKRNGKYCDDCLDHENLGKVVANAKYLIKYVSEDKIPKSSFFKSLNVGYAFKKDKKQVLDIIKNYPNVKFTVYKLNNTDFLEFDTDYDNVSFDFKAIGNNVPNIDGTPLYFNHLAEISKGANKLGVLKMDVDNLGLIFSKGFTDIGGASISRISSLSFYLDLFFSGHINQIVNKYNFTTDSQDNNCNEKITLNFIDEKNQVYKKETVYKPNENLPNDERTSTIHINYSGGDDLLVVGPYDDVIEFAQDFRCEFKQWTANNNDINISAGISIVSPKFPIGKAALMADEELEKSKNCGRDKITVFGETINWVCSNNFVGFDELLKFGKRLEFLKNDRKISSGFIYSLLKIWRNKCDLNLSDNIDEKTWHENNLKKLSSKRFVPSLMYKFRLIKSKDLREELAKKGIRYMPWIKTPVSWASLRLR